MTEDIAGGLENKAADPGAFDERFHEFMHGFEAFKRENDRRLAEVEKRGSADVVTEEKVARLNAALDGMKSTLERMSLDRSRPALEGGRPAVDEEYKAAFSAYVKRGEEKALSISGTGEGGVLIPTEIETEILTRLGEVSPIRGIATVRQVSTGLYRKPVALGGFATGWVAETAARPETDTPTIDLIDFPAAELYAMPAATQAFLDDAAVDFSRWISDEVNAAFAEQETTAFVAGDGTNKPKGFLAEDQVAEAEWEWGKIGCVETGVAGGFPEDDESDVLIDLVYALKAGYRQNATWVMNRRTQAAVRKLKDADGNYIWQPAATAGGRASLIGFPLVEAEDMPDIDEDTTPIAFGDFRRGYLVVDRQGVNVLRDPYSAKPYVLFYTTKRVGGGVQDFDAIKLLKLSA